MLNLTPGLNRLPPGNYGDLRLNGASGLAIVAAGPLNPPVFNSINLRDCHDIRFRGIRFEWKAEPGEPSYSTPNEISGPSSNIAFVDCQRIGSEVDGVPIGRGLMIGQDVVGVTFLRDTARTWESILICLGSDTKITGAHWTDTGGDIIQLNGVQGFLLQDSILGYFRAALGTPTHLDMIQLQMRGAILAATNITIRRNKLHSGAGRETAQSIFLGHEDLFNPQAKTFALYTKGVTILQNLIYAGHTHGVSLYGVDEADVGYNTLLYNSAVIPDGFSPSTYWPGIDVASSSNYRVHDNIAAAAPPGLNNLILQPADYSKYFTPDVSQPNCPLDLIRAIPGGPIYAGKFGAASVRP